MLVLSMVGLGGKSGIDTKARLFFKLTRRSGLWGHPDAPSRSAISKRRKKVPWRVFERLFYTVVRIALEYWPTDDQYTWHGMSVFAIDGSKFRLPASKNIRDYFDPESGLDQAGKGHYPQSLVSTVYDVFRRIPVARTVEPSSASEREETVKMLKSIPKNGILVFDRGYPSYGLILKLVQDYAGKFLFRCPTSQTFPALMRFIESSRVDQVIHISPTKKYIEKIPAKERKKLRALKVRAIKSRHGGKLTVLITSLLDRKKFRKNEIIQLYRDRWEVESYYRDEKVTLEVDKFHSKSVNGIRQELFAAAIMSVISRILMMLSVHQASGHQGPSLSSPSSHNTKADSKARITQPMPQFAHAVKTLAQDAAILVARSIAKVKDILTELINEIAAVKYYKPRERRQSQPRVNKSPSNKWIEKRKQRMEEATNA